MHPSSTERPADRRQHSELSQNLHVVGAAGRLLGLSTISGWGVESRHISSAGPSTQDSDALEYCIAPSHVHQDVDRAAADTARAVGFVIQRCDAVRQYQFWLTPHLYLPAKRVVEGPVSGLPSLCNSQVHSEKFQLEVNHTPRPEYALARGIYLSAAPKFGCWQGVERKTGSAWHTSAPHNRDSS